MTAWPTLSITEEVARFAFEIFLKTNLATDAYVAFSNPTAGPWKTVKLLNPQFAEVEVVRFGINEQRPDLVVVSSDRSQVCVIEAKAVIRDLLNESQIRKAQTAFDSFCSRLLSNHRGYLLPTVSFFPGFLWATETFTEDLEDLTAALQRNWSIASNGFLAVGVTGIASSAVFEVRYESDQAPPVLAKTIIAASRERTS